MKPSKRVIVALDVERADEARAIVRELKDTAAAFKIGMQLFTAAGPELVRELSVQSRIFLDLKFHDIPNTVAKAGVEAARLGVWMFNVHAGGGSEMMIRTANEVATSCEHEGLARPIILGVTVLTSSDANTLLETGIERSVDEQVLKLARLASDCGLDGVVASPLETEIVRDSLDRQDFLIVTPGVRPVSATNDDQKRVMTPGRAIASGSDYIVVGRPILDAKDRMKALLEIQSEIDEVTAS
jgi:orotidine-5'-phosphate decarboxylase